jgi:hypothetical protein
VRTDDELGDEDVQRFHVASMRTVAQKREPQMLSL